MEIATVQTLCDDIVNTTNTRLRSQGFVPLKQIQIRVIKDVMQTKLYQSMDQD